VTGDGGENLQCLQNRNDTKYPSLLKNHTIQNRFKLSLTVNHIFTQIKQLVIEPVHKIKTTLLNKTLLSSTVQVDQATQIKRCQKKSVRNKN